MNQEIAFSLISLAIPGAFYITSHAYTTIEKAPKFAFVFSTIIASIQLMIGCNAYAVYTFFGWAITADDFPWDLKDSFCEMMNNCKMINNFYTNNNALEIVVDIPGDIKINYFEPQD